MKIPLVNILVSKIYPAPPRFAGGPILNLLGYHVWRVLFFNLAFALRSQRLPVEEPARSIANRVITDGVAVIPDFFSPEIFQQIKNECDGLEIKVRNNRAPHVRRDTFASEDAKHSNSILRKHFIENILLNQVVAAVVRKDVLIAPKVQVETSYYHAEDIGKDTTDVKSDNLHFDVSYPTIKCFLYLTDVDENNAATIFVKGSHHLTLARLWLEYKMSVMFYWQWDARRRNSETPEVPQAFLDKHGFQ